MGVKGLSRLADVRRENLARGGRFGGGEKREWLTSARARVRKGPLEPPHIPPSPFPWGPPQIKPWGADGSPPSPSQKPTGLTGSAAVGWRQDFLGGLSWGGGGTPSNVPLLIFMGQEKILHLLTAKIKLIVVITLNGLRLVHRIIQREQEFLEALHHWGSHPQVHLRDVPQSAWGDRPESVSPKRRRSGDAAGSLQGGLGLLPGGLGSHRLVWGPYGSF